MPAAYIVALVIAVSVLSALVVALVMRRSMAITTARLSENDVEPLRDANAELERRLLLEEQKAARVAELEPVLAERVGSDRISLRGNPQGRKITSNGRGIRRMSGLERKA
jgi:hypothetical protein